MSYIAPVKDMLFLLSEVADIKHIQSDSRFSDLDSETIEALLDQSAQLTSDVIAPINQAGDEQGVQFNHGEVKTPTGWPSAYQAWAEGGWNGISLPEEQGGSGLPLMLGTATMEMLTSACMALGLGPVLSQGAVDTLVSHGSNALVEAYVPKLVSGEWMATMNITEPQAGSDLSAISTRATRLDDGSYRLKGQKIFITYGEHDLTDNVIHLVLATLPGAPEGTRGLSLFLAPKILPDGQRNDLQCSGVEHKLGLHGSPTCSMSFGDNDGAVAWLIGVENEGLKCMFTMMNRARLATGLQGVAIAERAWQQAIMYAVERKQGSIAGQKDKQAIVRHPDVQRMLLTMRALTMASRALAYYTAGVIDKVEGGSKEHAALADLLTPVVKAWCSDIGFEVASLGLQVHGGYGYIEETGAAQHLRDIRIASIYEGTNGIQAIDLVNRKVRRDKGQAVTALIGTWRSMIESIDGKNDTSFATISLALSRSLDSLESATQWLLADHTAEDILPIASEYMSIMGLVCGHALLVKAALQAEGVVAEDPEFSACYLSLAEFYSSHIASQVQGHLSSVLHGAAAVNSQGLEPYYSASAN